MPDDHNDQERKVDIDEDALLRSMGIMVPRHRIVHVDSETDGSKKDRNKKAAASKYDNIAKRVKEIWQQHGFGPGEDQRAWHGVLADIKSMITPLPDIEKTRSKVKRVSPAERSKPNHSESEAETTPELTHEHIGEQAEQIDQQNDCESGEEELNLIDAEDSNINKNETTLELTDEFIDDPAKEIWEQSESEAREYEQSLIETEGLDVDKNETTLELTDELIDEQAEDIDQQQECGPGEDEQNLIEAEDSNINKNESMPELTFELIAERAKQIWQQNGCRPGEDDQNWTEAEAQLKAELNID